VKSIGIAVPPQMTVSGSPVTGSGTITLGLNTTGNGTEVVTATNSGNAGDCVSWTSAGNISDAGAPCVTFISEPANTVFAAPDGVDGIPSFRHIVVHDLPFSYSGSTTELATVSGTLVSGSVVAVGANGNLIDSTMSTYFPGYLNASQVQGLAPSATIDTTNADNITSGTLSAARLPASTFSCPTGQVVSGFTLNDNTHPVCSTAGGTVSVGNVGALPYYSSSPEGATVSPDTAAKTDGNGNLVATSLQLVTGGTGALTITSLGGSNAGCLYTDSAGNIVSTKNGCGVNGTVTSVGVTMPDIFNVSNTPITSSGVITVGLNAQNAQTFLAGPLDTFSGSPAIPMFRNIQYSDLPGSPMPNPPTGSDVGSYVLGSPFDYQTIYPYNYLSPRWRHIDPRDFGESGTPNLFLASPSSSPNVPTTPTFRTITTADLPQTIFHFAPTLCGANQAAQGIDAEGNAAGCFNVAGGSVLSVGLSMPSIFNVSGSPVTISGTLTASLASQDANLIFAAPDRGAGTPAFRAMTATDLPASFNAPTATALATTPSQCASGLLATGIDTHGNANCTSAGVVTSVSLAMPDIFVVSGSPITTTGTLTASFGSQNGNLIFASPS
jgi:hypothetical protein